MSQESFDVCTPGLNIGEKNGREIGGSCREVGCSLLRPFIMPLCQGASPLRHCCAQLNSCSAPEPMQMPRGTPLRIAVPHCSTPTHGQVALPWRLTLQPCSPAVRPGHCSPCLDRMTNSALLTCSACCPFKFTTSASSGLMRDSRCLHGKSSQLKSSLGSLLSVSAQQPYLCSCRQSDTHA